MARKLIIKNADFMENGIYDISDITLTPLFNLNWSKHTNKASAGNGRFFPKFSWQLPKVKGKTIYGVRVKMGSTGGFRILSVTGYTTDPTVNSANTGTVEVLATFTDVAVNEVKDYIFDKPITISNAGNVVLGIQPLNAAVYYMPSGNTPNLYWMNATPDTAAWKWTASFGGGFDPLIATN